MSGWVVRGRMMVLNRVGSRGMWFLVLVIVRCWPVSRWGLRGLWCPMGG